MSHLLSKRKLADLGYVIAVTPQGYTVTCNGSRIAEVIGPQGSKHWRLNQKEYQANMATAMSIASNHHMESIKNESIEPSKSN